MTLCFFETILSINIEGVCFNNFRFAFIERDREY